MDKGAGVYVEKDGDGEIAGDRYKKELIKSDYFFITENAKNKFTLCGNLQAAECYR